MSVHEITHPLVKHKLGLLRQQSLSTRSFRQLTAEVGSLLTYEATSDLELEDYQVDTWMGPAPAQRIKGKKVTVVPILRAGIGMLDGVLELPAPRSASWGSIAMKTPWNRWPTLKSWPTTLMNVWRWWWTPCWRRGAPWWPVSTC